MYFAGNKKFMMGDDLTDIDCSLFGLFAQFLYVSLTCPLSLFIRGESLVSLLPGFMYKHQYFLSAVSCVSFSVTCMVSRCEIA